jgi:drug/metabolite transporter (DMT)-like permease
MNTVQVKPTERAHALPLPSLAIYGMLAFCLISWASSYIAIKVAVSSMQPHHVAVLRFAVASIVLAFFLPKAKPTMPAAGDIVKLFAYGASGIAVYSVLLCAAERAVGAGTASFIIGIAPIFTAVLASLWLKEKLSKRAWIGLAIAFAGAGLMSVGKSSGLMLSLEVVGLLVAAMLSGLSLTVQKSLLNRISPLACTIYGVWAGTILLLPFLPEALQAASHAPMVAVWSVVYLGVVPAAIGYIFWAFVLAHTPAGRAAAFLYLVPAVAALQSAAMLGEIPTSWEVAGSVVIMLAVLGASPNVSEKIQKVISTLSNVVKQATRTKPLCKECD